MPTAVGIYIIGEKTYFHDTITTEKKYRREAILMGLPVGTATMVLGLYWGSMISFIILSAYFGKKKEKMAEGEIVRFAASWLLAVLVCTILMNLGVFQAGLIEGWRAVPKW